MNSSIHRSFSAKKPPPAVAQMPEHTPSTKASVIFSFGSNAGTAKSSSPTGKCFFKSPIAIPTTATASTTTITTAAATGQPLFSATLDPLTKSILENATNRSLVVPRAKKTRKVRTTWSTGEDTMLKNTIAGQRDTKNIDWAAISQKFDGRNKKQCRDRWLNYLRPGIVKGQWTKEEGELIKDMHQALGPKWCIMSRMLKNRAENDIKNKWYSMTRMEKRLQSKKTSSNGLREEPDSPLYPWSFGYQAYQPPMPELATSAMESDKYE